MGAVLSLSLVPYGVSVDNDPSTHSYNQVNVDAAATIEAGT